MEMKISPAFEPFLANSGPEDKREAVVIFKASVAGPPSNRGRLHGLQHRQAYIKSLAAEQQPIQARVLKNYQESSAKQLRHSSAPTASTIGANILPVATVEVTRKTLRGLAQQAEVLAILPNQQIHLIHPQAVNYDKLQTQERKDGLTWGLKRLEIPKLWETTQGEAINIAVLDTGVYADHPALAGRVKEFVVIDPLGRRIQTQPSFDADQHGTHVCGTIAGGTTAEGVAIGVAPQAQLLVAGVLIGQATLRTLLEGISWAVERGADIINMSLGFRYYEPLFAQVFDMLLEQYGILPVVAIGNENHGNSSSPGNAYSAFSVGAVEKLAGKTEVTFFSSGASLVFPGQEPHGLVTKPDVVAPGAQIYSAIPPEKTTHGNYEYTYMDGTSMATPHVAGAAALLMAAQPNVPTQQIIQVLKETAHHPGATTAQRPDNRWGHGMIRPLEALKSLA